MILKYQKIFVVHDDKHSTTITLVEPDYNDGDPRMTELCTIGEDTYIHIPDELELPEQPFNIDVGMEAVILTNELKAEIKALSPHFRLAYSRLDTEKKSRLNCGFEYDGITFDSDINARVAFSELAMKFSTEPTYEKRWKASQGDWVTITASTFTEIMTAGETHVSDVFEWLELEQLAVDLSFGLA